MRIKRNRPERWAITAAATNAPFALWMGFLIMENLNVPQNTLVNISSFVSAGVLSALIPWAMAWSAARFVRRA
jgi:hypothetical protein